MFKKPAIFIVLAFVSNLVFAQAFEGKVKLDKAEEPAIVMVYDYPASIVNNAFVAKFADKQVKGSTTRDFVLYANAVLDEVSKSQLDYYFKLEEAGKKGEEKTTVYLVMRGAGEIEGVDQLGSRSKAFMENMVADVKRSNSINEIKKQEAVLVQEEESLAELRKAQQELEEKLAAHKAKMAAQEKIIASQKAILDDLKANL